MVWSHLSVDSAHVAYAVLGVFASIFSLVSLFVKERLYIGEATVAAIVGLIVGPHCLNWFSPTEWGNSDYITLEISRIVLCLQIFAVAVELPKKYMLKHWLSVFMLLVPVMTWGWLIVGLFIFAIFPRLNFADALTVAACVTATDPVLAAAVVGKGKFAQKRVPGHLRNLLSAESGCNDGMAFPFIYLGINLVLHHGNGGEIVKDWICVTLLYECVFGCILGVIIGYIGRHAIKLAERKELIDRESFLAFYVVLAFTCAGFGSMLGVDDLLVSFAAGAAFSWDGWFARKTEETHVSTVIDLLLNLAYFVYFGAIIPWAQFNNTALGLNVWRLILLAIVVIFLRRIPAVLAFKPLIPDIKTWREALFSGHFGPIGVGAVYAAIVARAALEGAHTTQATPTQELPGADDPNFYLISVIWPIVTFLIVTSIIVHGSSVAAIMLGRTLNKMDISFTFTKTGGNSNAASWMYRLPELKANGRSFSLHRVDTRAMPENAEAAKAAKLSRANTVETTGIPAKPIGGMKKKSKNKLSKKVAGKGFNKYRPLHQIKHAQQYAEEAQYNSEQLQREKEAQSAAFALGSNTHHAEESTSISSGIKPGITPAATFVAPQEKETFPSSSDDAEVKEKEEPYGEDYEENRKASNAYAQGRTLIIEDQHGEIMESAKIVDLDKGQDANSLERVKSQSTVSSIISPLRSVERVLSGSGPKYTAYKMGDQLVIENNDGEIVRRYQINHHGSTMRSRSSTWNKALSAVGLKSLDKSGVPGMPRIDSPGTELTEIRPSRSEHEQDALNEDASYEEEYDEDEEDEDEEGEVEEDEDDEEDEEDDEGETEVERARRLTALGQVSAPRDYDDEEETPVITKSSGSAK